MQILVIAADVLSGAVRQLHEAGLWNGLQAVTWDTSGVPPVSSVLGAVLSGLISYINASSLGEVLAYALYLAVVVPVLATRGGPGAPRARSRAMSNSVADFRPSVLLRLLVPASATLTLMLTGAGAFWQASQHGHVSGDGRRSRTRDRHVRGLPALGADRSRRAAKL